jgi:hypothetical protein
MGPQTVLELETTNEVAKQANEGDLRTLWEYLSPKLGNRRVFIRLSTPVPGVSPWGIISRINDFDGKWNLTINYNERGVDAAPYHFVDRIDRTKTNQRMMIVTLPVVNKIIERLTRDGWTIRRRTEDFVSAEKDTKGYGGLSLTMTPEGIDLDSHRRDHIETFDTINLLTE